MTKCISLKHVQTISCESAALKISASCIGEYLQGTWPIELPPETPSLLRPNGGRVRPLQIRRPASCECNEFGDVEGREFAVEYSKRYWWQVSFKILQLERNVYHLAIYLSTQAAFVQDHKLHQDNPYECYSKYIIYLNPLKPTSQGHFNSILPIKCCHSHSKTNLCQHVKLGLASCPAQVLQLLASPDCNRCNSTHQHRCQLQALAATKESYQEIGAFKICKRWDSEAWARDPYGLKQHRALHPNNLQFDKSQAMSNSQQGHITILRYVKCCDCYKFNGEKASSAIEMVVLWSLFPPLKRPETLKSILKPFSRWLIRTPVVDFTVPLVLDCPIYHNNISIMLQPELQAFWNHNSVHLKIAKQVFNQNKKDNPLVIRISTILDLNARHSDHADILREPCQANIVIPQLHNLSIRSVRVSSGHEAGDQVQLTPTTIDRSWWIMMDHGSRIAKAWLK